MRHQPRRPQSDVRSERVDFSLPDFLHQRARAVSPYHLSGL